MRWAMVSSTPDEGTIQSGLRDWLGQLPRDVAEKLAYRNAKAFLGLP